MKAVIVEIRDGLVAVLSDDGRISKLKNKNYAIGQVIEMKTQATNNTKKIISWAAAAAAVICISGTGAIAYASPYSYVSLDVNPSVEYTLNRFDRVLSVKAVNDDGKEIVEEIGLKSLNNRSIEDAMARTVQKISDNGFFDGDIKGGVVITTSGKDLKRAGILAEELKMRVEETIPDKNVEVDAEAVGKERVEKARKLGVTAGKLNLVEKLQAGSPNPDSVKLEEWLNKPVKEIMQEINDNRKTEKDTSKPDKPDKPKNNEGKKPKDTSSSSVAASPSKEESHDKADVKAQSKAERAEEKLESRLEKDNGNTDKIKEQAESKAAKDKEKAQSKAEKESAKESAAESRDDAKAEKKDTNNAKKKS